MDLAELRAPGHDPRCSCRLCDERRRLQREARVPRERILSDQAADRIAELTDAGLSQNEIAKAAGLSSGVISKARHHGRWLEACTVDKILSVCE